MGPVLLVRHMRMKPGKIESSQSRNRCGGLRLKNDASLPFRVVDEPGQSIWLPGERDVTRDEPERTHRKDEGDLEIVLVRCRIPQRRRDCPERKSSLL